MVPLTVTYFYETTEDFLSNMWNVARIYVDHKFVGVTYNKNELEALQISIELTLKAVNVDQALSWDGQHDIGDRDND